MFRQHFRKYQPGCSAGRGGSAGAGRPRPRGLHQPVPGTVGGALRLPRWRTAAEPRCPSDCSDKAEISDVDTVFYVSIYPGDRSGMQFERAKGRLGMELTLATNHLGPARRGWLFSVFHGDFIFCFCLCRDFSPSFCCSAMLQILSLAMFQKNMKKEGLSDVLSSRAMLLKNRNTLFTRILLPLP